MLGNYTSPWMTEDLTIFKDAASKFMQAEFVPLADKWHDQGMVDREAWNKAGEAGLLLTQYRKNMAAAAAIIAMRQ